MEFWQACICHSDWDFNYPKNGWMGWKRKNLKRKDVWLPWPKYQENSETKRTKHIDHEEKRGKVS